MVGVLADLVAFPTNFEVLLSFLNENVVTDFLLIFSHFLLVGNFRINSGSAIQNDKSRIMLDQATIIRWS